MRSLKALVCTSLGNHEFDDGVAGLAPFLRDAQFPVLAANINVSAEPSLQQPKLKPIAEFTLGGHKVGVIGYVTPETVNISFTGKVQFEDEVAAIRREARHLKARDVHIIIALGHSGYDVDLRIAEEVEDVDVVVGGHTNTFLYSGDPPDSENATDLYPTVVTQASGRKVPVVQAYAYTKYMGRLNLVFNNQGELRSFDGNPLLLNASIEEGQSRSRARTKKGERRQAPIPSRKSGAVLLPIGVCLLSLFFLCDFEMLR
ncbi:Protein 5NUC [Gryllus bimaculatus]|nr:Protein 5NUC [Gryllus bimaculatus]